ncbi:DUF4282 domain-containing protein [Thiomicrorhabdus sp. Kp2]|uniref:DUF4282 domain-containing protein n=1 Tax=Thiomicrorhabdus sp. Kp2 TaxID=1123518 RepID=UPI0003F7D264|nr:DUF4282 domain-containing protein [Thiomicrorhabdus sp. Kp2]
MKDFLTFHTLISIEVLIAFYYLGAVVIPLSILWVMVWLKQLIVNKVGDIQEVIDTGTQAVSNSLSRSSKIKWILLFTTSFVFAELFWRLLFEFLIAFMQMRDALVLTQ